MELLASPAHPPQSYKGPDLQASHVSFQMGIQCSSTTSPRLLPHEKYIGLRNSDSKKITLLAKVIALV